MRRRIAEIRDRLPGVQISFQKTAGERAYWCTRTPGHMIPVARQKDVVTKHQMRMAAGMFRAIGLVDYADAFDEHVKHLMNGVPHKDSHSFRKSLERLAEREAIMLEGHAPFFNARITKQIRLALLAGRKTVFHLASGEAIPGFVGKLTFDERLGAGVEVMTGDGYPIRLDLWAIQSVQGVEDLWRDYFS